jgi:iron complex transport system substrate-binding protein
MRDLTYVKLIFFGKKSETELADAKYDGKINPLDFIQIKLIIVGKEKELTVVDTADRTVTVKKPIERVVATSYYSFEVVRMLGAKDKLVSRPSSWMYPVGPKYFPELSKLPGVGYKDYETILNLNPDLVITYGGKSAIKTAEKLPGIPVAGFSVCYFPFAEEIEKLGYIFDKEGEAKHYIDDFQDIYLGIIKTRTEGLSEEKRPKVYEEAYTSIYTTTTPRLVETAGGRDIFADSKGKKIDPEAVIEKNPDIIIKLVKRLDSGYEVDDISKLKAIRDEIMNRPELAKVAAVKNGRVYVVTTHFAYGIHHPIMIAYYAKWFHPDLFEDLDPQAIHQQFVTEFQGVDFSVYEQGVWVYPPLEE